MLPMRGDKIRFGLLYSHSEKFFHGGDISSQGRSKYYSGSVPSPGDSASSSNNDIIQVL